ncbi:hypothetical protein [Leptospira koniambonensis]|uniref:hypothetical protein n=1 Tax=Leptospira koniambonensis TaxID=2484950 RepID=UPI003EB78B80
MKNLLEELFRRNKFKNINNLLHFKFQNKLNYSQLIEDYTEDQNLISLIYILLNSEVLKRIFDYYSLNFVYEGKSGDYNIDKAVEIKIIPFLKLKERLIESGQINKELLSLPIKKTASRIDRVLFTIERGYHTYGDFEICLSSTLSCISMYSEMNEIINLSKKNIENIRDRVGLVDVLLLNVKKYYDY